jgi:hypothetical protein
MPRPSNEGRVHVSEQGVGFHGWICHHLNDAAVKAVNEASSLVQVPVLALQRAARPAAVPGQGRRSERSAKSRKHRLDRL